MKLTVLRFRDTGEETFGVLFIDGAFECFTLEDQKRTTKVKGDTRIDEGEYVIQLATTGGHHTRYLKDFPKDHIGMLLLQNVPNFQGILIHIGNTEKDTEGCLLVGTDIQGRTVTGSTNAYLAMYRKVAPVIKRGEKVTIKYVDINTWIPKF